MSRGNGDRAALSRGPCGDATAARDAGATYTVAGVPSAARSRFTGPSGNAPGRPPREAWGCDRRMAPDADNGRMSFMMNLAEAEL